MNQTETLCLTINSVTRETSTKHMYVVYLLDEDFVLSWFFYRIHLNMQKKANVTRETLTNQIHDLCVKLTSRKRNFNKNIR